jgi:hypothetical protein
VEVGQVSSFSIAPSVTVIPGVRQRLVGKPELSGPVGTVGDHRGRNRQVSLELAVREFANIFQAHDFLDFSHRDRCRGQGNELGVPLNYFFCEEESSAKLAYLIAKLSEEERQELINKLSGSENS